MDKLVFRKKIKNVIASLILITSLMGLALYEREASKISLKTGDLLKEDIISTEEIEAEYRTNQLKEAARRNIPNVYRIDPSIKININNEITSFFKELNLIRENDLDREDKLRALDSINRYNLSQEDMEKLLDYDSSQLDYMEDNLIDLSTQMLIKGVRKSELNYEKNNLISSLDSLSLNESQVKIAGKFLDSLMEANKFLDEEETERKKDLASEAVEPIIIAKGEVAIRAGKIIDQGDMELLAKLGMVKGSGSFSINHLLGMTIIIGLGVGFLYSYIYYFNREILRDNKFLVLNIIIVLTLFLSKAAYNLSAYIMPLGLSAILISVLIDNRLSIFVNILLSSYLGYVFQMDLSSYSMYILGSSIYGLMRTEDVQRYSILIRSLISGFIQLLVVLAIGLSLGGNPLRIFLNQGVYGFLSSIISGILALGSLPIWENIFSILTPFKLLELSNPNQPLLKRLLLEAPGTYHHSVLVGNLSEGACEKLKLNGLLARVGSYYHDIGKLMKPYYFSENQFGIKNPHDDLEPLESAKIILSHREDGLRLAKENRLPKEIKDIINEHHGTSLVAYFYYKHKEALGSEAREEDFRYQGLKPRTKEAGIVMLADSCEAAVRSIRDIDSKKIEDMVRNVIKGKINDDQLIDSGLSFQDVRVIEDVFINILKGIYQVRVEYPKKE